MISRRLSTDSHFGARFPLLGDGEWCRHDPPSIGGVDDDPARPEGLLTDVQSLPVNADDARLRNAPRGGRNR